MTKTELALEFITFDGQPGSRPPIFDPVHGVKNIPIPHELDCCGVDLMVIPADQYKPLNMSFMLFYLGPDQEFEWCSKYSAPGGLFDDCGDEVVLDEAGYIIFPLQKGDRWAIWPALSVN